MAHLFVMQRANGEYLTETIDNNRTLLVWPDFLSLQKYKVFNPELSVFLPKPIDSRVMGKLQAMEKQGTKLLLMTTEEHSPDLKDGLPTTVDKLEESLRPAA